MSSSSLSPVKSWSGWAASGAARRARARSSGCAFAPDRQRQGLGRRILEALEVRARELGFESVVLDTTEGQDRQAGRLYEASGYRETGRRDEGRFVFVDFVKTLR